MAKPKTPQDAQHARSTQQTGCEWKMRGPHSNLLQYLVQIDYNMRGKHSNLREYAVVVTDVTDVADVRAYRDADTVAL